MKVLILVLKTTFILNLLFASSLLAFPEMIRHGYPRCINCHSSIVGGDLLTAYGRSVKREILTSSYWTTDEQEKKGLEIKTPEWLQAGINTRLLQYFNENSQKSRGRFLIMQADVDLQFTISDNWKFYASLGRYEPSQKDSAAKDFLYAPREWITYENDFFDEEKGLQIRAGKFFPSYGLYQVEHTFGLRKNLEFNPGQERVAVEASVSTEHNQFVVTNLIQRANYNSYDAEKGYILQYSRSFENRWKLGVNIYRSQWTSVGIQQDRKIDGVFAAIGWDSKTTTLIQFDKMVKSDGHDARNFFLKTDYEFQLGWHSFFVLDYWNPWVERTDPHTDSLGAGLHVFWLPNLDIQTFYKKEKNSAELNEYQDVLWFIVHSSI